MTKINWKNLQIGDNLALEGLSSIEECTDYDFDLPKTEKRPNLAKKSKSAKKPKLAEIKPSTHGSSQQVDETITNVHDYIAWNSFNLPAGLIRALVDQKFEKPTDIQALTLPAAILGKRDILGAAETGSGKTLAFGLPILAGILHQKATIDRTADDKPLYALILTPTRELAMQVTDHLRRAAKYVEVGVAVLVGGMAAVKQVRVLSKQPEIVVATPGRFWELYQAGNEHLAKIAGISYFAIDETDRMLEKGHFEELGELLGLLNQGGGSAKRQNFVFSATLTLTHDLPKHLVGKRKTQKIGAEEKLQAIVDRLGVKNAKVVDLTCKGGTAGTLTESRISCGIEEKDFYVYYFLLKHPGRTLIFCNSIGCVRRLVNLLQVLQLPVLPLHAQMQQRQRLKNLERFRDDNRGVLVATDVAARGLDIPEVEHVLHYQTPRTSESYVHRSGRTARALRQGLTVVLIEPGEIQNYVKLCKTLEKSEDLPIFPVEEGFLNAVKERVKLARQLDKFELDIRKGNSEAGWFQKAAEEMDILIDDFDKKFGTEEMRALKKQADFKRKQLAAILKAPIFPKGYSGKFLSDELNEMFLQRVSKPAVEIMKESIIEASKDKTKRNIPLFKRNRRNDDKKPIGGRVLKLSKGGKSGGKGNNNKNKRKRK